MMIINKRLHMALFAIALTVVVSAGYAYSQVNGFIPTKLQAFDVRMNGSGVFTVSAKLTTFFGGRPIVGAQVTPFLMYEHFSSRFGPVYTDNDGVARLTLHRSSLPAGKSHLIGWSYTGNGFYSSPLPVSEITFLR